MVADGIHVMLGVALAVLLLRTDRVEPYLIAMLTAGIPDMDWYLFTHLPHSRYLSGPMWAHRGITHSLVALVLFVGLAYGVGYWRPAAIGYGSHLVADLLTGGIQLLAPVSTDLYGLYYDWTLGSMVAGGFAVVVLLSRIGVAAYGERPRTEEEPSARVRGGYARVFGRDE
jgi:inner membrane protein